MKKIFLIAIAALSCIAFPAIANNDNKAGNSTAVEAGKNATHIARITKDSIVVITGSTYLFTVDTPEDQGLVSTGITAAQLPLQLTSGDGSAQQYTITGKDGMIKKDGEIVTGDRLTVTAANGKDSKTYFIAVQKMALSGRLHLQRDEFTIHTNNELVLYYTAGQRTPDATVRIVVPAGIEVNMSNTTVNVIGRGEVLLKDLATQSPGRTGTNYSYSKVGEVAISRSANGGSVLTFRHLDLRPANGPDLVVKIQNIQLAKTGHYHFTASYTTSAPEKLASAGTGIETATLTATRTIMDLARVIDKSLTYKESPDTYTKASFTFSGSSNNTGVHLQHSTDKGKTWKPAAAIIDIKKGTATVSGLQPGALYSFRLSVQHGDNKGFSNTVYFFSGKMDIKSFGIGGEVNHDYTGQINEAIAYLHQLGGGILLFSKGIYSVRTVHLQSNVWLYVAKDAEIRALKGADAPEPTWFSDKKYRSGLSPTDPGPYADPENYLTKQDVGHTFFRNTMFFGERLDNVKIIGNGYITGNGNLVTGDRVMNNAPDNRADKMFTFKLCTNIEIGGLYRDNDLWYDSAKDEPYYLDNNNVRLADTDNMLHIDRGGHFVLLATGTDNIHVHDTYFARNHPSNARDIYDFMGCSNVTVTNIYSKVSSDDIVKLGSDCSLGFTRPAGNYKVRNVIGDTNCNLFQIGSETADDITDVCVDNIYVLGANKAGFSISTNDGGHVKNIHLNCGHTGTLHSRSKMYRTRAPFFISISNRGRVLGADVGRYVFTENGKKHDELLVKNVSIGKVENITLNGIDIYEVYGGSSFRGNRWKAYDGSQNRATPVVAGYQLPDVVEGGYDFKLPNGLHTGYITNITFNDVHVLVKGGHPAADSEKTPPELGVGQYNVSNLGIQPSYGLWARHVKGLTVKACSFNYEQPDHRYAIFLDDVAGAAITNVKMMSARGNESVIRLKGSSGVSINNIVYYKDKWQQAPVMLPERREDGKE